MAIELIYTSSPRGLRPGTSGYCTVAHTTGMPSTMVGRLEALSIAGTLPADATILAHWRMTYDGQARSVLTRIGPNGLDYSRRPNRIAHHVVLGTGERPASGPAPLLASSIMRTSWPHPSGLIGAPLLIPAAAEAAVELNDGDIVDRLINQWRNDRVRPIYVRTPTAAEPVRIVTAALASLSADDRWAITFNTCFTQLPAGVDCAWRFVIAGTAPAAAAERSPASGVILDAPLAPRPPGPLR